MFWVSLDSTRILNRLITLRETIITFTSIPTFYSFSDLNLTQPHSPSSLHYQESWNYYEREGRIHNRESYLFHRVFWEKSHSIIYNFVNWAIRRSKLHRYRFRQYDPRVDPVELITALQRNLVFCWCNYLSNQYCQPWMCIGVLRDNTYD